MKMLLVILAMIISTISCKKELSAEKKPGAHVLELSFELETINTGDKIIIKTVGTTDSTVYYDCVVGLNKVTYTVSADNGQLQLLNQDIDGKRGSLDYLFYNVKNK